MVCLAPTAHGVPGQNSEHRIDKSGGIRAADKRDIMMAVQLEYQILLLTASYIWSGLALSMGFQWWLMSTRAMRSFVVLVLI
jgi:hypothetical protein